MKPPAAPVVDTLAPDFAARRIKALLVHKRLCAEYGAPFPFFSTKDPLSELVSALLSHRTKNADSHRAYQALRAAYSSWEAVRDAPTAAVQHAIRACSWPEQKAPRIQTVLREISVRCGTDAPCALDFLAEMPIPEARAWLESISGVGPKTSAATLLFSTLRIQAMPVDSHHHRVAQRLGLIGPKVGKARPTGYWRPCCLPTGMPSRCTTIMRRSCSTVRNAAISAGRPAAVAWCWTSVRSGKPEFQISCSFIVDEQRIPKPIILHLCAKPNARANQLLVAPVRLGDHAPEIAFPERPGQCGTTGISDRGVRYQQKSRRAAECAHGSV